MDNKSKAIAKLTTSVLANVAVVGFGLAIFEQRAWCAVVAIFTFLIACIIEWRINDE